MIQRLSCALLLAACTQTIAAAEPPATFANGHDNPRTAYPSPVPTDMTACTVELLQHGFADFEPLRTTLDTSACPGPWHKVILRLDGAVKGRQYDRIGHLAIGGITIFRTSTPEPSPEGIEWQVEKDITAYAPLLTTSQPVEMTIGNVVNETYTGVFDVRIKLQFYRADADHPAAVTANEILALKALNEDGQDTLGTFTISHTAERVVAEVYATGSGGGCEEFWYFSAPSSDYWCKASHGPYREVQVLIDGHLAGIAAPYPHIYTGGWSNPFLWYTIPAPRAFNILPIRYELTPFIGLMNDGKPHEIRFRVAGLDGAREGWKLMPNLQVWNSADGQPVTVRLLQSGIVGASSNSTLTTDDNSQQHLRHFWQREFVARAEVGNREISISRNLQGDITHHWIQAGNRDDRLQAQWRDDETITYRPSAGEPMIQHTIQDFSVKGSIASAEIDGKPRITTTLDITDEHDASDSALDIHRHITRDHFSGTASWTRGERERRRAIAQATAHTTQTWQSYEYHQDNQHPTRCRARHLVSQNGVFTEDTARENCGTDSPSVQPSHSIPRNITGTARSLQDGNRSQ